MKNTNTPFVHFFKTYKANYIYDFNTNAILKVHGDVYDDISRFVETGELGFTSPESKEVISSVQHQGYLNSFRWKEILHPASKLLPYYLDNCMQMLTLQVTQACNLRCAYCTYSGNFVNRHHSNVRMSYETAKSAVDFYIKHSTNTDKLNFGFYGGEPLLEFDLIKNIIEYIEKNSEGKEKGYNLTTNATLLNEEIVSFFQEYDVRLTISIDGPKEIHDKNRIKKDCSGSFDTIIENIKMISEKFPSYADKVMFNCVLDPRNDFGCINEFFTNYEGINGFYSSFAHIAKEYIINDVYDTAEEYSKQYDYEVFKMFMSKIGRLDKKHVSKIVEAYYLNIKNAMIDNRPVSASMAQIGHHGGPCIAGMHKLFVNAQGDFYPCEKVSECSEAMKIGNIDSGFDKDKIYELINIGQLTENQCKGCWAAKFCYLCALFADDSGSLSKDRKAFYCMQVRENIEQQLKEYCLLKEMNFDEEDVYIL